MTDSHPVLPGKLHSTQLRTAVYWSPPFQAPPSKMPRITKFVGGDRAVDPVEAENAFYDALSLFQEKLDDPALRYEFTMQEGDAVLFDNNRVLHARTAFRDKTDEEIKKDGTVITPGEPTRWLKGLYLDGSTVWDRISVLNDQVRGRLA